MSKAAAVDYDYARTWAEHDPDPDTARQVTVSYTHLTLPTTCTRCRSRWSPYH